MPARKTWNEKLDNGRQPKIVRLKKTFVGIPVGARMLVSTPREVDALIKKIPAGRLVPQEELRRKLAIRHSADATCPSPRVSSCASPPKPRGKKSEEVPIPRRSHLFGEPSLAVRLWPENSPAASASSRRCRRKKESPSNSSISVDGVSSNTVSVDVR